MEISFFIIYDTQHKNVHEYDPNYEFDHTKNIMYIVHRCKARCETSSNSFIKFKQFIY